MSCVLIISARRRFHHNPSRPDESGEQHDKGEAEHSQIFAQPYPAFAARLLLAEGRLKIVREIVQVEIIQVG